MLGFSIARIGSGRGTHSLAGEGVGGVQLGRGDRHCGTLGICIRICTLWTRELINVNYVVTCNTSTVSNNVICFVIEKRTVFNIKVFAIMATWKVTAKLLR
jgi:hypothetical protein